jgi:hypothetical protein
MNRIELNRRLGRGGELRSRVPVIIHVDATGRPLDLVVVVLLDRRLRPAAEVVVRSI